MATDDPFSTNYQQPTSTPPPSSSGKRLFVILALVGTLIVVFCGGMGTIVFLGIQRATGIQANVDLPSRDNAIEADQASFNQALMDPCGIMEGDADVREFVERSIAAAGEGQEIAFNNNMFMEAVSASQHGGGELGFADRLMLRNWLLQHAPTPVWFDGNVRILNIRLRRDDLLATVDLLIYSETDLAESHQWFLIKEGSNWQVYDWQILEEGRRMSDEYASYLHGATRHAEGYDEVLAMLTQARATWSEGDEEAAREILQQCERTPMLPADRPVAKLRTAYAWMTIERFDEAIRVLNTIRKHEQMWGFWPTLAACHLHEGDTEASLKATLQAAKQSPRHPNVQWLLAQLYAQMDRQDEAADAAADALRICQADSSLLYTVANYRRAKDIPVLFDALVEGENEAGWASLLQTAAYSSEWATTLVEQISLRDDLPLGVAELAAGELAVSRQEYDDAAKHFVQAKKVAQRPSLQETATREHFDTRLAQEQFVELFAESDDVESTLATLVQYAYDDELYCDTTTLLNALQQHASVNDIPWTKGLRGWAHYDLSQWERSLADLDAFLDWLQSQPETIGEDRQWISHTTEYYIVQTLLELGRPMEVISRWPDDVDRHQQVGNHLKAQGDPAVRENFLQATSQTQTESIRLQRLRLQADAEMRAGNAKQCDLRYQEAIESGLLVHGTDDSFLVSELIRQRAGALVWNRLAVASTSITDAQDSDFQRRDQLISNAVDEAVSIRDEFSLEQWIRLAEEYNIRHGDTYAGIQYRLGEFRLFEGDYSAAAQAFQNSVNETEKEQSWNLHRRREGLMTALLKANRMDEAHQLANPESETQSNPESETESNPESAVPASAIVNLASGDTKSLRDQLSNVDKDDVARWLSESPQNHWLAARSDDAAFLELIEGCLLRIEVQPSQATGVMLFSDMATWDAAAIKKLLDESLNDRFECVAIPQAASDDGLAAWLATSATQQRVLIGWAPKSFAFKQHPPSVASVLKQPVYQLAIEILDYHPQATKRLFDVATHAVSSQALAFSWSDESLLWMSDDLSKALAWQNRVPVGPQVEFYWLQEITTDDQGDTGFLTLQEWEQKLQEAKGDVPVVVTQTSQKCSEAIPCDLVRVEVDNYDLIVRPQVDSKMNPAVKAGIQYRCRPSYVSQSSPE